MLLPFFCIFIKAIPAIFHVSSIARAICDPRGHAMTKPPPEYKMPRKSDASVNINITLYIPRHEDRCLDCLDQGGPNTTGGSTWADYPTSSRQVFDSKMVLTFLQLATWFNNFSGKVSTHIVPFFWGTQLSNCFHHVQFRSKPHTTSFWSATAQAAPARAVGMGGSRVQSPVWGSKHSHAAKAARWS